MTIAAQFADAVRQAAEGTPYVVQDETPNGFTLHIDVADAQWWAMLHRAGLRTCFSHTVVVDEAAKTYQVADRSWTVEWSAGTDDAGPRPTLRATGKLTRGTVVQKSRRVQWARNPQGDWDKVVDYGFDSTRGSSMIKEAGARIGLRKKLDPFTKLGLGIAVGAVVFTLVLLAVFWMSGMFG